MDKRELKKFYSLLREKRLEEEKTNGRQHSKSWDGKKRHKDTRREEKIKLKKFTSQENYYDEI